ncbi:MAG TPA: WbuC family cupin fold metalloprotein [Candidatus Margulisiibacteriota bacterium]|nr:WbuC family cupin fold metalloprotein [Candidatus Margulisiibacteriota bacterium]
MPEFIKSRKGTLIAVILSHKVETKGVMFFTPPQFSQQVGLLRHEKGSVIKPHMHKIIQRKVEITQEVLHVKKGKILVSLFDEKGKFVTKRTLGKGDTILLANAGHGIKILQSSLILEIKQGPYAGVDDKEYIGDKTNDTG